MYKIIVCCLLLLLNTLNTVRANSPQRVLLIGNSYTYCNDLPNVLMALSRETDCPLVTESFTIGAMSLHGFLQPPLRDKILSMLQEGHFDWIVLQDQSQTPAYKPDETMRAVQEWTALANNHGTKILLFLTWAHATRDNGELKLRDDMQRLTGTTYCRAALCNKVRVAPVGEAWARWYRDYPGKALHVNDCSHPNPAGTYLAACVIHGTISGKPLKNIPGRLLLDRRPLINIPSASAKQLQKTANATLKEFSPQRYLDSMKETDRKRLSAAELKPQLKKGMTISQLTALVGKPHLRSFYGEQRTYQFRLRGEAELCAYCSPDDVIEHISIASPGGMAEIIDLR